ncbi:hypothetical protein AAHA92_23650 [Salvia divinorum]|uniref:Uncharacterized protein n=1 Tax=Salvia divinorum TaxID=28513 RepID=A0ABD1GT18_SALDI
MGFECEGFDPLRAYGPHNPFKEGTTYYGLDDYSSSSDDDDEAKKNKKTTEKPPFDTTDLIKYITQVRNSFGFDVDVIIPPWLMNLCMLYLIPIDASRPSHHNFVHKAAKTAIDEINVDMKSKSYELVEVAKFTFVPIGGWWIRFSVLLL